LETITSLREGQKSKSKGKKLQGSTGSPKKKSIIRLAISSGRREDREEMERKGERVGKKRNGAESAEGEDQYPLVINPEGGSIRHAVILGGGGVEGRGRESHALKENETLPAERVAWLFRNVVSSREMVRRG